MEYIYIVYSIWSNRQMTKTKWLKVKFIDIFKSETFIFFLIVFLVEGVFSFFFSYFLVIFYKFPPLLWFRVKCLLCFLFITPLFAGFASGAVWGNQEIHCWSHHQNFGVNHIFNEFLQSYTCLLFFRTSMQRSLSVENYAHQYLDSPRIQKPNGNSLKTLPGVVLGNYSLFATTCCHHEWLLMSTGCC